MLDLKSYCNIPFSITILFFCIAAGVTSCTEPEEGCLDVLASNFEIDADSDCCTDDSEECCCNYPSLRLNLFYKGTATDTLSDANTNIRLDTYYPLENLTDSIRIDSFSLFVSELTPIDNNAIDTLRLFESLQIESLDANGNRQVTTFQDNIALVAMPLFQFTLGTYRSGISIDELSYNIGLQPDLATVDPSSVSNDHPLGGDYTVLYNSLSQRYLTGRVGFTLKRGVNELEMVEELTSFTPRSQQLATPIVFAKGVTLDILMRINMLDLFKGIIFDISTSEIPVILDDNLNTSIFISE